MTQKGAYPYEYMDSFARFQEPQLPPNQLTEEDISEIDYTNAQKVFIAH